MSRDFDGMQIVGASDDFSQSYPKTIYCTSFMAHQPNGRRQRVGIVSTRRVPAEERYAHWKRLGLEDVKLHSASLQWDDLDDGT